ncbi:hypothetical protein A9Z42_0092650 [Trichoderma parareesei]|uniref:Uncharacterized protein n=1 Tax=Trichoderma parareesei TaxID=858221 RepID=A0A2H2ZNL9_TRIPA|nr:hypothetical protein A9Z42_0092650 [Trichoderma parareesei]
MHSDGVLGARDLGPQDSRIPRAVQNPPLPHPRDKHRDERPEKRAKHEPRPPEDEATDPVEHHDGGDDGGQREEHVEGGLVGGELLEGAVGEGLEMRLDAAGLEEELALEGLEGG